MLNIFGLDNVEILEKYNYSARRMKHFHQNDDFAGKTDRREYEQRISHL